MWVGGRRGEIIIQNVDSTWKTSRSLVDRKTTYVAAIPLPREATSGGYVSQWIERQRTWPRFPFFVKPGGEGVYHGG